MPEAQSNIGIEQRLDICILEREIQEIAGRSHALPAVDLLKCFSISVRRVQCVKKSSCVGKRKGTSVFTAL
jgi:hypothetical protein